MTDWQVPGHTDLELLGYGLTGEVWRARSHGSGVALRRLGAVEGDVMAEVRRWATVVRSLPTRHVVRVRSTLRVQGEEVLVVDLAEGGSLAALLAQRGTVEPGEVVTVLAPLAEALGHAHAHGLVHGRLSASAVLLTADGMPLLDGLGLDALRDPADLPDSAAEQGPAADVRSLGDLGHRMLAGSASVPLPPEVPASLAEALTAAADPDPAARPTAVLLAARLLAACPALPLSGLPDAADTAPLRVLGGRRPRVRVAASAVAALALVSGAGWAWGSRAAQAPPTVPVATPNWVRVVIDLDAARGRAFATASPAGLRLVYADASPMLAQDEAALADLRRRGVVARGLVHDVASVTAGQVTDGQALLLVTQSLRAYQLLDRTGLVLERHTAGPAVTTQVVLVRGAQGWRVRSLTSTR